MAVVQESIPLRLKNNTLEKSYDGENYRWQIFVFSPRMRTQNG
jgi:hypothetical protein